MRNSIAVRYAIRVFIIIVAIISVLSASAQTTSFTKKLDQINGVSVTGNPPLTNGDLLRWVLTYQYSPSPAPPAQTEIRDLLSPALQYVPGSLQAPPSWTRQWFNGTWVNSEPAGVTGVGVTTAPNLTPFGAGQTALIPAPPVPVSTTGAGGDGYRAVPAPDGNVYLINHHNNGKYLDCFVVATGSRCANYPVHVPNINGASWINYALTDNGTPGKTYEYVDRIAGRLYFPVEKINATPPHEIGVLCADLATKTSCGFYALTLYSGTSTGSSFTTADTRSFQGIGAVGKRVYMALPNNRFGCLDTAPAVPVPCTGQPYPNEVTAADEYDNSSVIVGTRIYSMRRSSPAYVLSCLDTTTNAGCGSNWPRNPDPTATRAILYPLLDNTGAGIVQGICALTTNPTSSNAVFQCYDLITGTTINSPPTYASWARIHSGGFYQSAGYGQSGFYRSRVFNANPATDNIGCYDFVTAAPCAAWPAIAGPDKHYATIPDPERPGCMWYYGHDGELGSFRAADGRPCSGGTAVDLIIDPSRSYCATNGNVSGWDRLYLSGLGGGGGITAALTIYDGNNPNNLAVNSSGVPYAQNQPVMNFPLLLGSGGLNIGYGTGSGQYRSLRIVLDFSGVTSNAPWTQTPPPSIEVTWIGGPPEFCFQTRVATCETPVIINVATAVTRPFGGAAINDTAPNPPFSATHLFGSECPARLTVKKTVNGAPAGFTGTFKFYVTCSTPNGLVQQQLSITWPNTTASLNLPGGGSCIVSEDPALPPLPPSHSWAGLPSVTPAGGIVQVTPGGANQAVFTNVARPCDDHGKIRIRKRIEGAPPGFSGTFTFNVACWSGSTLITQQAQITLPGQSTVTVPGIPTGSVCTVTEVAPLPALPADWFWQPPLYNPASGQVSLIGNCCPEIVVINRPKYCCPDFKDQPDKPDSPISD